MRTRCLPWASHAVPILRSISLAPHSNPVRTAGSASGPIRILPNSGVGRAVVIEILFVEFVGAPEFRSYAARLLVNFLTEFVGFLFALEHGFWFFVAAEGAAQNLHK